MEIATHANLIYTPKFFRPKKAYESYVPDLTAAYIEGVKYARKKGLRSAMQLEKEGIINMAMLVDLQQDFRPSGRLPVKGTDNVVLRASVRLLNGTMVDYYTRIIASADGHPTNHISYATRWQDEKRERFDLSTRKAAMLELIDRNRGVFQATCFDPSDGSPVNAGYVQDAYLPLGTVKYWDHLQSTGQGPIWLFETHCKLQTNGVMLHPLIQEVLSFIEGARGITPLTIWKGHLRDTDWFGALEPCKPDMSHPQGGFQKNVIDEMIRCTNVDNFGVAQDFCDYFTKLQVLDKLEGTDYFKKMVFVEDGTAPIVPNAPHVIALEKRAKKAGVRFINHDAPFPKTA